MDGKHAFVATVPFTLIEAINFVVSMEIEDADVYITRSFADAENVAKRLATTGVFKNVFIEDDVLLTYPITVKKCWNMVKNGKKVSREISKRHYDYAYYNNSGWLINSIFYTGFVKGNKDCKHRFLEHGYSTYLTEYGKKPWYLRPLIHLTGYKCMDGSMLEALYMFDERLLKVHQDGEIRKMPFMDRNNKRLMDALNTTFNFNPEENEFTDKDVIIMELGPLKVDFDMASFWEEALKELKKDISIIKSHPRQKNSALQSMGIDVAKNHGIPWEIIALNTEMEKKTQITIFSGSCIMPKTCCDIESNVILLYKLLPVDYSFLGARIVELTEEIRKLYKNPEKLFIPETWDELSNYLSEHF